MVCEDFKRDAALVQAWMTVARWAFLLLVALAVLGTTAGLAVAQPQPPPSSPAPANSPPPAKVQQLIDLMGDPEVKKWLETRSPPAAAEDSGSSVAEQIASREARIRDHIASLKAALPRIPQELAQAGNIVSTDVNSGRPGIVLAILATLLLVGYGAEWVFRRMLLKVKMKGGPGPDGAASRADGQFLRLVLELVPILVFSVASAGLFLAFEWPPLLRRVVLTFLVAFVLFRIVRRLAMLLLELRSPAQEGSAQEGIVEESASAIGVSEADRRFWYQRISILAGLILLGWAATSLMGALGFSPEVRELAAYVFGLGVLALAIEIVWRRPGFRVSGTRAKAWLLTFYLVVLWLLWVAGMVGLFWLGVYALLLPTVVSGAGRLAQALVGSDRSAGLWRIMLNVLIARGARALVIAAAVAWLGMIWRERAAALADSATAGLIVGGLLNGIIIVLIADLLWQLSKTYIEYRQELATQGGGSEAEIARNGRLRTLLPIFRNILAVFIAVVAVLTILSGLGVQIGPLIAGAGIFGVAIGFGAQTLVKDVLSGVFYMLDDAFRVGEYIESGSYKGTVESFSLRSVRLRHHRGPVFTVPFGDLGAVQNMSRDWVIDKMTINVTYDSDVDLARKLIKKIGQELAQDPEFAASTIQPLKMQGVDSFGDFAIVLRMKLMTKPGEQFAIKRKAYVMIKKAFDENGIKIAVPTVRVSGGEGSAAAAEELLRRRKKAAEAAEQAAAAK